MENDAIMLKINMEMEKNIVRMKLKGILLR